MGAYQDGFKAGVNGVLALLDEYRALWKDRDDRLASLDNLGFAISAYVLPPELSPWLPIEQAPKDGTKLIVWFKGIGAVTVQWVCPHYDDDDKWASWCIDDNKNGYIPLRGWREGDDTHFMPPPPGPEGEL